MQGSAVLFERVNATFAERLRKVFSSRSSTAATLASWSVGYRQAGHEATLRSRAHGSSHFLAILAVHTLSGQYTRVFFVAMHQAPTTMKTCSR